MIWRRVTAPNPGSVAGINFFNLIKKSLFAADRRLIPLLVTTGNHEVREPAASRPPHPCQASWDAGVSVVTLLLDPRLIKDRVLDRLFVIRVKMTIAYMNPTIRACNDRRVMRPRRGLVCDSPMITPGSSVVIRQ